MLYKEQLVEAQVFLFGTWAQEYFFSEDAATNAATFSANEDLYAQLCEDLTVCTKLPVQVLDSIPSVKTAEPVTEETTTQKAEETIVEAPTDSVEEMDSIEETDTVEETEEASGEETETEAAAEEITEETTEETTVETETSTEATTQTPAGEEPAYINILMLTPRDGLPQSVAQITGLRDHLSETLITESDARSERNNELYASVFGKGGPALVIGSIVIAAGVVSAIVIRKKKLKGAK